MAELLPRFSPQRQADLRRYPLHLFRHALTLIAQDGCEKMVKPYGCYNDNLTADAKYGADRMCAACIARLALEGSPLPMGPGIHADE